MIKPLPKGTGPVATVGLAHEKDNVDAKFVLLTIGRPLIEETEAGEIVATLRLNKNKALELAGHLTVLAADLK